jgi:DNA-binding transcriptional LysR family regulator
MDNISYMQNTDDKFPDLSLLPALDALLETASVTRAGELIGLSQPAMSRVVAKLRAQFNDPLIVRIGARSQLTPRANALRLPLKTILEQAVELTTPARFDPQTTHKQFTLAIPDVVAAILLPSLRAAIGVCAPNCKLVIAPWPGKDADKSHFDLAIATDPKIFPNFRIEPLYDDHDVLAFRSADSAPSTMEALRRAHVGVTPTGITRDLADDWLADEGHSRVISIVVPHYLQALNLVAHSDLLAILPSRLVQKLGAGLGVAGVELELPQTPDRYWLLHPAHLTSDPANQWIRRLMHKALAS